MSAKRSTTQVVLRQDEAEFLLKELKDHSKRFIGLFPASETVQARTTGLRLLIDIIKDQLEDQS